MSRALISFLIGFGLLLFFLGLAVGKAAIWFIGLLIMGSGLYYGLGPEGILRKDEVLDNWAILIEKGQGKAEEIFRDAEGFIKESKAPALGMERQSIAPGIVKGLLGAKREYLVVTDRESFRLRPYQIFVNARDYGDNLDVSWHLAYRPTLTQAILLLFPYVSVIPKTLSDLDLFDQQDLRAYATIVHHSVRKAVQKVMVGLQQDPSEMERKSRGFLGIS